MAESKIRDRRSALSTLKPGRTSSSAGAPEPAERSSGIQLLGMIAVASLPGLAAFSGLFPVFGSLSAFRLLVLVLSLLAPIGWMRRGYGVRRPRAVRLYWLLAVVWIMWALAGAFITGLDVAVSRDLLALGFGLLTCTLLILSRDPCGQLIWMRRGWITSVLLVGGIGVREAITGVHLPNYLVGTDYVDYQIKLVASVFGNPNAFALFLIFSMTFVLGGIIEARRGLVRFGYWLIVPFIGMLLLMSGSRLGLAAFALMILGAVVLAGRRVILPAVTVTVAALVLVIGFSSGFGDLLNSYVAAKVWTSPSEIIDRISAGSRGSGTDRWHIYLDGAWLSLQSGGVGFGPGSFVREMASRDLPYPTWGILSPHNLLLEVAVQYGLVVVIILIALVITIGRSAWTARTSTSPLVRASGVSLVCALPGVFLVSFANSSFILVASSWVFLGTCLLACIVIESDKQGDGPRVARGRHVTEKVA